MKGARSATLQRGRRRHPVAALTISLSRVTQSERATSLRLLVSVGESERPRTRGDCADGPRPCPFVSCRHHLWLDVNPRTGSIKQNFPDLEPGELAESCVLDAADRGGMNLDRVADRMNLTKERARQIEQTALRRIDPAAFAAWRKEQQ